MICDELACKMGVRRGYSLGLQEVICNRTMFRPIHHSEILLDIVLLWGCWDEKYRKDNYIICLFPNSLLFKIMPYVNESLTMRGELKFADKKSKLYKYHLFKISDGKLKCYKNKSELFLLYEWSIKDLMWFVGYEPNRNPHSRPKDHFGWSIAGNTVDDDFRWMAALLSSVYGVDQIAPPVTMK